MVRPSFIKSLSIGGDNRMTVKDWAAELLWYNNFSCFLRRVGRFIKREVRWAPILWNQEEWDFSYMYDLLVMKMKELKKDMSKDYWHEQKSVQRGIKQIDICLARLDRYRNWPDYYDYPLEDIYSEPTEDGCYKMCYASEKNEKQRQGAHAFEEKNYNKFWKDFLRWHQGWWT